MKDDFKTGRRGFTLIEMLVVIGIIAVLIGASLGSYSAVTKMAEKTRAKDLVGQVALALAAMYEQEEGQWPLRIAAVGESGGELDELVSYTFVSSEVKYLTLSHSGGKLTGYDKFGILDPWGVALIKQKGNSASFEECRPHRLWFAVDSDGDGIIKGVSVGGESVDIRATAVVWGAGKDGKMEPYTTGLHADDVYSWTVGQTRK